VDLFYKRAALAKNWHSRIGIAVPVGAARSGRGSSRSRFGCALTEGFLSGLAIMQVWVDFFAKIGSCGYLIVSAL
jgi:hypothetical protein